jgi:ribosomal protein S18 acetylase RimI-like enzyme
MELVDAGKEELDSYIELWFSLAKSMEKYSELNEIIYDNTEEVSEDSFIEQLESDKYTYYLIKDDSETIGFLVLKQDEHPSREYSKYTKIINLFIKEEHRNQGYGTKSIEEVKQIARESGSDYLKVSSEWGNIGAREFYKDNGFKEKQVEFAQKLE